MRSWLSVLIADAMSKKRDDIPIAPSLYSLSNKMDNSLLAVRDINHKYIVVEESGFSLKDLTVNDKKIDKEKEYSILLTDTTMSVLKKINPKCEIEQLKETTLSSAWIEAMSKGQQPSAPEDYIEVEQ